MLKILPIDKKIIGKAIKYGLTKKRQKQLVLLVNNPRHPSLNFELL